MTKKDPSMSKSCLVYQQNDCQHSAPTAVPNVKCAEVNQIYQYSLGMMPSILNTEPIPSVPKCNWCTKRNDCNKRTENDQEWS